MNKNERPRPAGTAREGKTEDDIFGPEDGTVIEQGTYDLDEVIRLTGLSQAAIAHKVEYKEFPPAGTDGLPSYWSGTHIRDWLRLQNEFEKARRSWWTDAWYPSDELAEAVKNTPITPDTEAFLIHRVRLTQVAAANALLKAEWKAEAAAIRMMQARRRGEDVF